MFKKLVIVGSVLFIAGAGTLGWVLLEKRKEQQTAANYRLKYGSETSDYLKQYNDWLGSPPEERAELPLGLDEYGKAKTKGQLLQEQHERLQADLDKLAGAESDVNPLADILYGENWQNELAEYKKRKELRELVLSASILCMLTGGAILTLLLLLFTSQLAIRSSSRLKRLAISLRRGRKKTKRKQPIKGSAKAKAKIEAKAQAEEKARAEAEARAKAKAKRKAEAEAEKLAKLEEKIRAKAEAEERVRAEAEARAKAKAERKAEAKATKLAKAEAKARAKAEAKAKIRAERDAIEGAEASGRRSHVWKHSNLLRNSGWQGVEADSASQEEEAVPEALCGTKSKRGGKNSVRNDEPVINYRMGKMTKNGKAFDLAEKMAVLLSDEKSSELEESLRAITENLGVGPKLEDSLKAQSESFEKQVAEFKEMAQSVQQAAVERSEPINNTLAELTQQVAAIREYATCQQDRLEKLQDGYDWNIIKTFCLRVIRCIDNLENRISRLPKEDVRAAQLEEVRDELIFALESSGVEKFEPEINSGYRGQEKYAEAIKEKESCKDRKRKGKIAEVIKPGYQYFINEENVKVVRPAQVKLFA